MGDDCDEDVIFENSPLYQHLKDVGIEDIGAEPVREVNYREQLPVVVMQDTDQQSFLQRGWNICEKCWNIIKSLYLNRTQHDQLRGSYQQHVFRSLSSSSVLVEEDLIVLQDITGEQHSLDTTNKNTWTGWIFPSVFFPCLLATIVSRLNSLDSSSSKTYDLFLGLMTAVGIVYVVNEFQTYRKKRNFHRLCSKLTDFLDTAQSLSNLTRKCLRLIQETELVARGFTLVSQKTAVSQLERAPSSSTVRLCPELRKCLFTSARAAILDLREATLQLLTLYPLSADIDSVSNYLCGIPLEEYGPCLRSCEVDQEQDLYHLTDGFSVAALKAVTELFHLHQSEFVRRLALCFSPLAQHEDTAPQNPFDTSSITDGLHKCLSKMQESIQRLYHFHKSIPQVRQAKQHVPVEKSSSQTEEFYTAVHSLDLHLQAAITRVRDLANKLEQSLEDKAANQNGPSASLINENWETFMGGVKAELEACKGCWEEGMSRLEKSKKKVPKLDVGDIPQVQLPSARVIPFEEIGEPIIEDEVFEAYTDPDEIDTGGWSWEPILSPEEKEKKKREKQEALRLLSELKSVISIRAKDREKREEVALSRMGQGKITPRPDEGGDRLADELKIEVRNSATKEDEDSDLLVKDVYSKIYLQNVHSSDCDNTKTISDSGEKQMTKSDKDKQSTGYCESAVKTNDKYEQDEDVPPALDNLQSSKNLMTKEHIPESYVLEHDFENDSENIESEDSETDYVAKSENAEDDLKSRLERIHGMSLGFTANVAAMAAARSVQLREQRIGDTFGESSSDDDVQED